MPAPLRDPVPPLARAVLDVFRDALADVRFPDVDRATLEESEAELLAAQIALEAAEFELERARASVAERSASLTSRAQRALAYAKVFAEDDPVLRDRLDSLSAPRARASEPREEGAAPVKRRGRPRKNGEGASLFAPSEAAPGYEAAERSALGVDPRSALDVDAITDAA
jgi:hypothetical protein